MDALKKLGSMKEAMSFEPAEESDGGAPGLRSCSAIDRGGLPITNAALPNGQTISLLKTLQTSVCERDCTYCCFRAGRDTERATLTPDEMATVFMRLQRAGVVQGIFLSSGVAGGGIRTQDRIIDTVEILRLKMGFRGYVHLKIMPGAEQAQVERAMQLADRVSINLEAPNPARLATLAPKKTFMDELLRPLQWIERIRQTASPSKAWNGRWPSSATQFVVGGAQETDLELLSTTAYLQRTARLARAYFSAFKPVKNTPLEHQPPENPWRQNRLYQAFFLLRDYGFEVEELPFAGLGNLPLATDPKLAWAAANLREAPIEVNQVGRARLMRIPGIGPKSAAAILAARRQNRLRELGDLRRLGIHAERAAPFILLDGRRPAHQMSLF